jgi:hypothetical protein
MFYLVAEHLAVHGPEKVLALLFVCCFLCEFPLEGLELLNDDLKRKSGELVMSVLSVIVCVWYLVLLLLGFGLSDVADQIKKLL